MDNQAQIQAIEALTKAISAGNYDAAPSSLVGGAALQIEDCSPTMNVVTFQKKSIKLQKFLSVESCKATLTQFDRQLSYGIFGGGAQMEGSVGQEETSDYVRITVPMAYYSHTRRVTIASTMVTTVDGKRSDDRSAEDAALKLAGDIEFDLFRGMADFSSSGVFDGNPLMVPSLPNIHGLDLQIRQSDGQTNSQDLMFDEYGNAESVVIPAGGPLTQSLVEDGALRSSLNHGEANKLIVDPVVLSTYNKITFGKERMIVAGSAPNATGGDLRKQWVSGGTVDVEGTIWLRGKATPNRRRTSKTPQAPASIALALVSSTTPFLAGDVFTYYATSGNEMGESPRTATQTTTILNAGEKVEVTITQPAGGTWRFFNVYRTPAGGSLASAKFIGRVIPTPGSSTTVFTDAGNRSEGSVTGFLVDESSMHIKELSPYSSLKLAQGDLSLPTAHFRFLTLATVTPRFLVLFDDLLGTF